MDHHKWDHGAEGDADVDELLRITRRRFPTAAVVFAAGEIDLASADRLATALRAELDGRPGTIVVDLTGVKFMGSIGMALLAEADRAAKVTGQLLRVVVSEGQAVFRSIMTSGMAGRLSMFFDLDDAIATI